MFGSISFSFIVFIVAAIVVIRSVRVVPQQTAYVVERLGRYRETLQPGLNFIIPFVDRLAYKHDLSEITMDVPSQVCITRDNTQLQVDGVLYFQVMDPSSRAMAPRITGGHHPARADHAAQRDRADGTRQDVRGA